MTPTPVLVVNPNRTAWMTERVAAQLRRRLGAGFAVRRCTAAKGPAVIDTPDTFEHGARVVGPACAGALARHPGVRAVLLACFGDPGLEALRTACGGRQVVGLADAAMTQATRQHGTFAILTCGPAWVDMLERRAAQLGHARGLAGVWALPVNGRDFALDPIRWVPELQRAAAAARRQGAKSLILGGAAFAGLEHLVESDLPRVDPLVAVAQGLAAPPGAA